MAERLPAGRGFPRIFATLNLNGGLTMHPFLKSAALLCAGSIALLSPARAATTLTLDTSGSSALGCSSGTSCFGNARTFSLGSGADAVNVRVTGWSLNGSMTSISDSWLGMWDAGFGVTSSGDYNGNYNLHAVDNYGRYDFLVFQFDKAVEVESFKVTPYKISGKNYYDSDVSYGAGMSDVAWNASPFSGSGISELTDIIPLSDFVTDNTNSNGARTVGVSNGMGNLWVIGARFGRNDSEYDNFKVDKVEFSVVTSAVPEPATWAMMIFGFGAVGASMRRRRKVAVSFA